MIFIISDLEADSKIINEGIRKLIPFNHTVFIINPFSPWFEIHEVDLTSTDKALAEAISEEMMEHILTIKQGHLLSRLFLLYYSYSYATSRQQNFSSLLQVRISSSKLSESLPQIA